MEIIMNKLANQIFRIAKRLESNLDGKAIFPLFEGDYSIVSSVRKKENIARFFRYFKKYGTNQYFKLSDILKQKISRADKDSRQHYQTMFDIIQSAYGRFYGDLSENDMGRSRWT
jgi:hypothetical protein